MAVAAELARAQGWPRHLFARVASEPKPVFVDLASPPSLDVLAHIVRRADRVDLSEMLPAPGEAWLEDAGGRRYVAELRVVVTDPRPFPRRSPLRPDPSPPASSTTPLPTTPARATSPRTRS